MRKIKFTKMVASGNDFVVSQLASYSLTQLKTLARNICERKYGIGADGLLILEKSKVADVKMRIFNPDGCEPSMCGNGARCVAFWQRAKSKERSAKLTIETRAGIIESEVNKDKVKIKLTNPRNIKLDIPIKISNRSLRVNFINTGVPHTLIFVEGLEKIDVVNIGRQIRYHRKFAPGGTNVDFVEILGNNSLKLRTYERGVEDETLACGTGVVAASLISNIKYQISNIVHKFKINVYTKSGEILNVYFEKINNEFKNVWLEGKAKIVYRGEYCFKDCNRKDADKSRG